MAKSFKDYNLKQDILGKFAKVVVTYPGQGDTGEHLMIRSLHSQEWREAMAKSERQMAALISGAGGLDKIDEGLKKDIEARTFTSIIESWSFEEPCTIENIVEFFDANPHMYDKVNTAAAQDTLFFVKPAQA